MESNRNYLCTERAHLMCPNMHFGILAQIESDYDFQKVRQSVGAIRDAHPFLRSVIAQEEASGRLYYQAQEHLGIFVEERPDRDLWQQDYDEISRLGWDVRKECLLKVLVYQRDKGFSVLFIAHHLLCDGRGLLQLAEEFAQHYVKGITPTFVEERLIQSLEDLPANSDLPFISKVIVNSANKNWKKEQHKVTYEEYSEFEKHYIRENRTIREIATVDRMQLKAIHALCKQHHVSVNDYLIAKMMLEDNTNKVIIAADIRSQVGCYRQGAMGNYATAFSVVVKKQEQDIISLAQRVASRVADIRSNPRKEMLVLACYLRMQPELIDAVAISTLGGFESEAGAFVGKNMFGYASRGGYSITNLGRMESDVIAQAVFIPPASPANQKTLGVLTVNGMMKLCSATSPD